MTDQQRIDIKADGIYVNDIKVPGFIEEGSVTVTPGGSYDLTKVHLTLIADEVHCDAAPSEPAVYGDGPIIHRFD